MSLRTQITADMDDFFDADAFAQSCTWGGSTINIIFDPGEDPKDSPSSLLRKGIAEVQVSDVATPVYRTAVVIDGTTWYVKRVISGDAYTWRVELETNERPHL